jgi:hypothetical protein
VPGHTRSIVVSAAAVGVAVGGTGVFVGAGVSVGPPGVFVGAGVSVGPPGVFVGAGVSVGPPGVFVGAGVSVGPPGVFVGAGVSVSVGTAVAVGVGVGVGVGVASVTVTSITYDAIVAPSAAVTVAVIHVFGPATLQLIADCGAVVTPARTCHSASLPTAHGPADDAYDTVAPGSLGVAVTSALVVPSGTSAVYDVVVLTNAGASVPGEIASPLSDASSDGCTVTSM